MNTIFNIPTLIADTDLEAQVIYDTCPQEFIDTTNKLEEGEIIITKKKLLDAFAKVLGIEDASGWSTGQLIIKHLFGE